MSDAPVVPPEVDVLAWPVRTTAQPLTAAGMFPAMAPAADHEFLAETDGDWLLIIETLLHDFGAEGSIVVYSNFEKTQLKALAKMFPALEGQISAVLDRLFDPEQVFKSGYQHPGFAGRTSIKKVLLLHKATATPRYAARWPRLGARGRQGSRRWCCGG